MLHIQNKQDGFVMLVQSFVNSDFADNGPLNPLYLDLDKANWFVISGGEYSALANGSIYVSVKDEQLSRLYAGFPLKIVNWYENSSNSPNIILVDKFGNMNGVVSTVSSGRPSTGTFYWMPYRKNSNAYTEEKGLWVS